MSVPPKMSQISLSGRAIISQKHSSSLETDRPAEKCEPFLSTGSEHRMNYELHMPFKWGHRPFTTLTWSQSRSNKKTQRCEVYIYLTESNVMIIDPVTKCVFLSVVI